MRQILLVVVIVAWNALALSAQDMKSVFTNMPDSVIPLLTSVNRADLVDFLDSRMKAEVTNRLDGKSVLRQLSDDYFLLELSEVSSVEGKLLPVNDSTCVIGLIHTCRTSMPDSRITFRSVGWQPVSIPSSGDSPRRAKQDGYIEMRFSEDTDDLLTIVRHGEQTPADTLNYVWAPQGFILSANP